MKISGVDIRPGNIIEYEGGIWRAVKIQHTQPGKGGAYMQVEMKNLIDGRKTNVRFRSRRDGRARAPRHQGLPVPVPRRRHAHVHGQGQLRADQPSRGLARRRRRLPPGRHGRGDGALQREADQRSAARPGRSDDRRGRRGGEGPDRELVATSRRCSTMACGCMVPPHIGAGTKIVVDVYNRKDTTVQRRAD